MVNFVSVDIQLAAMQISLVLKHFFSPSIDSIQLYDPRDGISLKFLGTNYNQVCKFVKIFNTWIFLQELHV